MKVTDASAIVNEIYVEMTGKDAIDTIDNSNIVDIGTELQTFGNEKIYNKVVDRIGKLIVRNKQYTGKFLSILRDGWEFGNILQTLRVKTIEATTDPSYAPTNGATYSQDTFTKMDVVQKFFQDYDNFQLEYWRPTDQLWTAFNSMDEMTRFFSGVELAIQMGLNKRLQGLAKLCITNMIAQTLYAEFPDADYGDGSGNKAVNLLKLYNDEAAVDLTVANCRQSADFLRFAAKTINNYYDRIQDLSVLFNIDGEESFSRKEDITMVILSTFANDIKYNLYNAENQFDFSLMELPNYETVPYWQASGTDYDEETLTQIKQTIKTFDDEGDEDTETIDMTGILAVMFDRNSCAINCERKKVTQHYNANIDQYHFYDKYLGQYINDFSENFIVFYIADPTESQNGEAVVQGGE